MYKLDYLVISGKQFTKRTNYNEEIQNILVPALKRAM